MKHKAVLITMVSVAAVCVIVTGVMVFNPSIVQTLVSLTSGTQSETNPPTEAPTQAPTQENKPEVKIEKSKESIERGATLTLKTVVTPQNMENKEILWESSDADIASVDAQGKITGVTAGDCVITARLAEEKDVTAVYNIKVTDSRIHEINLLNDYFLKLPESQKVKNGDKSVTVKITQSKIGDFNTDGHFELLIRYQAGASVSAAEIVSIIDEKPVSRRSFKDFEALIEKNGTSYDETIYTDEKNNFYIKSTEIKNDKTQNLRTVTLYSTDGNALSSIKSLTDVYLYKKNNNVPEKGEFTIDGKGTTEANYLQTLSSLTKGYNEFSAWTDKSLTLVIGKYNKAQSAVDLEEAYLKRIEWKSSAPNIAEVNQSGVITGKDTGKSVVTGSIPGINGAVASVNVTVRDNSDVLNKYLDSIKNKVITGSNNTALALYASKILDVDGDGIKELLLYYTGGRTCQVDIARQEGTNVTRKTAFSKVTDSDSVCRLDIYMDNSQNAIVLNESYRISNSKDTVEFRFNKLEDGKYIQDSHDFKVVSESANDKNPKCYIDSERTEKEAFDSAIKHYGKYADWDVNE